MEINFNSLQMRLCLVSIINFILLDAVMNEFNNNRQIYIITIIYIILIGCVQKQIIILVIGNLIQKYLSIINQFINLYFLNIIYYYY